MTPTSLMEAPAAPRGSWRDSGILNKTFNCGLTRPEHLIPQAVCLETSARLGPPLWSSHVSFEGSLGSSQHF